MNGIFRFLGGLIDCTGLLKARDLSRVRLGFLQTCIRIRIRLSIGVLPEELKLNFLDPLKNDFHFLVFGVLLLLLLQSLLLLHLASFEQLFFSVFFDFEFF